MNLFKTQFVEEGQCLPKWHGVMRHEPRMYGKTTCFAPFALIYRIYERVAYGVKWKWFAPSRRSTAMVWLDEFVYDALVSDLDAKGVQYSVHHPTMNERTFTIETRTQTVTFVRAD